MPANITCEGYLEKRTRALLTWAWHKRYFMLNENGTLSWFAEAPTAQSQQQSSSSGGSTLTAPKDTVSVRGVAIVDDAKLKRTACFTVAVAGGSSLLLSAPDVADAKRWMTALAAAVNNTAGLPSSSQQAPRGNENGSNAKEVGLRLNVSNPFAPSPVVTPTAATTEISMSNSDVLLPTAITIEGMPMENEELRLLRLDGSGGGTPFDGLSLQWIQLQPAAAPTVSLTKDIVSAAGGKHIPGATGEVYTVQSSDVGTYLGCVVRLSGNAASTSGSRWALLNTPTTPLDAGASRATVQLRLQPHEHNKYCDRRLRVCTAAGRYREGSVLIATPPTVLPGASDTTTTTTPIRGRLYWYRSGVVMRQHASESADTQLSQSAHAGVRVNPSPWGSTLLSEATNTSTSTTSGTDPREKQNGSAVSANRRSGPGPLHRVIPRPVTHLPPAPPDHAPAVPLPELKQRLALMASPWPPSSDTAATSGASNAPPPALDESLQYPLFVDDTDKVIAAVWAPIDNATASPPDVLYPVESDARIGYTLPPDWRMSRLVGPVEAAPPRAREIWIDGIPAVGETLVGHFFYYGGSPGASELSWVAIGDDGSAVELLPARPLPEESRDAYHRLAHSNTSAVEAAKTLPDNHPAVLKLEAQHAGALIKFRVRPVRSDGDAGHAESSRPTKEIAT